MVLVDKIIKRWNQLSISSSWSYSTTKEFHVLKKSSMASIKLLTNHFYVRCICIYNNPAGNNTIRGVSNNSPIFKQLLHNYEQGADKINLVIIQNKNPAKKSLRLSRVQAKRKKEITIRARARVYIYTHINKHLTD